MLCKRAEIKRYFAASSMNYSMRFLFLLFFTVSLQISAQSYQYPLTPKMVWTDTYPGDIKVEDPYHWLEDDNSLETKKWAGEQNKFTFEYLDIIPGRDSLKAEMTRNWNFMKYDVPFHVGNSYMYFRNDGLQNQPILFYMKSLQYVPMAYFDPNKISTEGTTSIMQTVPSTKGDYLAFVLSNAGSDWNDVRIKETKTMKTLPEALHWLKFSNIAWYKEGFFYSRYDAPDSSKALTGVNLLHKIYYHKLNTGQGLDSLVFEDPSHPLRTYRAYVDPSEKSLIIMGSESTSGNSVTVIDLRKPNASPVNIVTSFKYDYSPLGIDGNELIFLTNKNADRKKVVKISIDNLKAGFSELIPEQNFTISGAEIAANTIVLNILKDATSKLFVYTLKGTLKGEIPLPFLGTVEKMNGSPTDSTLFFSLTGFTNPAVIYRFDVYRNRLFEQFKTKPPFNPDNYITEQVFYLSKDKTKIPMFLVYKKGMVKNGNAPVLLYGYGGFNISKTPEFKAERIAFLDHGGMIALPNLRGGGEYGTAWHEAGTKERKQNVFDDCIAAAEWLIKEGYTQPSKLALQGRSNGGLLVGAVMVQRPDLFNVALPAVGVLDMLRYHKFTIGWGWAGDYGTSEDSTGFAILRKYSPYHNLKPGIQYPATLITTADHDDRVVPAHSFKFAARLQEIQTGKNPILLRVDAGAGHGAGKPTSKQIEEQTDIFSFLFYNLGMKL